MGILFVSLSRNRKFECPLNTKANSQMRESTTRGHSANLYILFIPVNLSHLNPTDLLEHFSGKVEASVASVSVLHFKNYAV